jgi:hypothetical protein
MQHCRFSHQLSQCFWGHTFGSWAATVDDSGSFTLTAALAPSGGTQTRLAARGTFIDQYYNLLFAIRARHVDWPCFHERCVDLFGCRALHFHRLRGPRFR